MNILWGIILGALFGFVLYLVGASSPKNLLSMLRLEDLTLMKIIVFAIGFASVLLSLSSILGIFNISHLSIKTTNLGVILGGLIFGLGFGWVGTCPGTCLAASSSGGLKKAISAILGGILGALTFSLSYIGWKQLGLFDSMNLGKLTLFNISDKYPSVFNIGYLGLLSVGIIFMIIALVLPNGTKKN